MTRSDMAHSLNNFHIVHHGTVVEYRSDTNLNVKQVFYFFNNKLLYKQKPQEMIARESDFGQGKKEP